MATFFDVNSNDDLALLHESVRRATELVNVINQVEWELIDSYTQRDMQGLATYENFFKYESGVMPGSELKVRLAGYNQATPADSEVGLKEAIKRTIADIASEILRNYDADGNVASQSQGNRAITYAHGSSISWRTWPNGWNRRLNNYDAKIKPYGI
jgi:hypothetical protein